MPDMNQMRYTHMGIYSDHKLMVFGGREFGKAPDAILSSCEYYNEGSNKWIKMASLNHPRCTGSVMSYQD